MPQFDATTFPSQLIWLVITFVLLYIVLSRVALPRISSVLEERQRRIGGDLEKAEELKAEAEAVLSDYDEAIAKARSRATDLIRETKDELAADSQKRQHDLAERLAQNAAAAESRIGAAREEAVGNIRQVAAEAAQAATERLIGVKVGDDRAASAVDDAAGGRG